MRLATACVLVCLIAVLRSAAAPPDNEQAARLDARRSPVVQVFESARDAVVNISCTETVTVRDPFEGFFQDMFEIPFGPQRAPNHGAPGRQYTRTSVGSGFVIHPDGYIVTNAHVVAQTPERKAIFADGREFEASVVAFDTARDLAVLKINADRPLPTLKLGRSHDLMIGETVIAIGNPLGYQNTVTAGVVSAIDRDLHFQQQMKLTGLIQTDASINPGNSGGPLLNVLGELIGVNTAIRGDAQNIGFAIPVDQLRELLPDMLDVERRYRLVCGLTVDTLNAPRIVAVKPDSPAERAGLRTGDVLTSIGDHAIREGIDFSIALMNLQPEQTVDVQFQRDGQPQRTTLTLARRPAPNGVQLAREKLGLTVEELPTEAARTLGLPGATGLLITGVERGSPAERLRVQRRDVLVAVGRHAVNSPDDLGQLLEQVSPGESVTVTLLRVEGRTKYRLYGEMQAR